MAVKLTQQTIGLPWECDYIPSLEDGIFVARALHLDSHQGKLLIVCNPIGEEAKSSFSTINQLCWEMWMQGWHVIRFDYVGTGDSAGDFSTTTPKDWIADARLITQDSITRTNARSVVLMGVRLGANIAARVIEMLPSTLNPMLVLWEPVLDMDAYVRHLSWVSRTRHGDAGIDYFGWKLTDDCLAEMRTVLPLEFEHFKYLSFIANVSTRSTIGREFDKIRLFHNDSIKLFHFKSRPFWELINTMDCTVLIQETLQWLIDTELKAKPC